MKTRNPLVPFGAQVVTATSLAIKARDEHNYSGVICEPLATTFEVRRRGLAWLPGLTAGLLLAASAAPAAASGAQVFVANNKLNVVAALGVENDIEVALSGSTYTVHDPQNPLAAGIGGCVAVNANTVTCPLAGAPTIEVLASDMNDTVTISANKLARVDGGAGSDHIELNQTVKLTGTNTLLGGPGNDQLLGSIGRDSIDGSVGNDTIDGGGGADSLSGGGGDDDLFDGDDFPPDSADSFNGGSGHDVCGGENSLDPKFGQDTYISCEVGGNPPPEFDPSPGF